MKTPWTVGSPALAWLVIASACGDFEGDGPTPSTPDGGLGTDGSDGSAPVVCNPACNASEACLDGKCQPGCPDKIVYVGSGGNDSNSGCSKSAPKATISSAIAIIKTANLAGHEIHVCKGTYDDDLTLDAPITMRGGYECAVWSRVNGFGFTGVDATGAATGFDTTNETVVTSSRRGTVLTVSSPAVTRDVRIEGFTFKGRDLGGGATVRITNGASPVFTDDVTTGPMAGVDPNLPAASIGIDVDSAGPEITHCRIGGGGGGDGTALIGSVGINLMKSTALVHDNTINAGHGSGTYTSAIGVRVVGSELLGDNALAHNFIGYQGTAIVQSTRATVGIVVGADARANVLENRVVGGQVAATAIECSALGIALDGAGSRAVGNRIFAGDGAGSPKTVQTFGIYASGLGSNLDIYNNLIDTGLSAVGFGIYAFAGGEQRRIAHNTIFSRMRDAASGIMAHGFGTTIENNLLVHLANGLVLADCTSASGPWTLPQSITSNAFVANVHASIIYAGTCGDSPGVHTTVNELQTAVSSAQKNVFLRESDAACAGGDSYCKICGDTDSACITNTFADPPDKPQPLSGTWMLKPGIPCRISQSDTNLTGVTTDAVGSKRNPPPSIGALEFDGNCTP